MKENTLKIYEITNDKISDIKYEIRNSIKKLEFEHGIYPSHINIAMPYWFKNILERKNQEDFSFIPTSINSFQIYGKKIVPHYKNEVVVFDYFYSPTNEPKYIIIEI